MSKTQYISNVSFIYRSLPSSLILILLNMFHLEPTPRSLNKNRIKEIIIQSNPMTVLIDEICRKNPCKGITRFYGINARNIIENFLIFHLLYNPVFREKKKKKLVKRYTLKSQKNDFFWIYSILSTIRHGLNRVKKISINFMSFPTDWEGAAIFF